jgi:Arc/MetJ family transcription regulator
MTRTNIDLDDDLVARVMRRYGVTTKREAVNLALSRAALEPLSTAEALAMQGSGWDGNLEQMRDQEPPPAS